MKTLKRSIQIFSFSLIVAFAGIHFSNDEALACDSGYTAKWNGLDCYSLGSECEVCIGEEIR